MSRGPRPGVPSLGLAMIRRSLGLESDASYPILFGSLLGKMLQVLTSVTEVRLAEDRDLVEALGLIGTTNAFRFGHVD